MGPLIRPDSKACALSTAHYYLPVTPHRMERDQERKCLGSFQPKLHTSQVDPQGFHDPILESLL